MQVARSQSLRRLLLTHELAFLTLIIITGALAGTWAMLWQQSSEESIRLNFLAHTAEEIRSLLFKQIQDVSATALRADVDPRALNSRYARTIQELFNELRRRSAHRAEDYAVQNLQMAFSRLQADLRKTLHDPVALNRLVRSRLLDPAFEQRFVADFEQAFAALIGLIDQRLAAQERLLERRLDLAPYAVTVPVVFGVALLLFSRRSLTKGFVEPVQAIMAGTREMSSGNLDYTLAEAGVEEVRELAQGINRMASELNRSRAALLDHERQAALGSLIPVVAHNIRNPLAAIRANAQVLDGSETAAELGEIRQAIIDTVDRLERWVTALVSYLHPLRPRRRRVAATALIDTALNLLQPRLAALELTCSRAPWDEQAFIDADSDLMEQAVYALINNAVEASSRGAALRFGVERRDAAVRIVISDDAGGIPFTPEPTELAPGPSTKRFGTGLGIPIAFKICNTHGFRLEFFVRDDSGTDVVITAPASAIE